MPNGSRMITPGCVITSIEPVRLLIRTATWPASTAAHECANNSTSAIAPAAIHKREGSPLAPFTVSQSLRLAARASVIQSPPSGTLSRADHHSEQVLARITGTQRELDERRRQAATGECVVAELLAPGLDVLAAHRARDRDEHAVDGQWRGSALRFAAEHVRVRARAAPGAVRARTLHGRDRTGAERARVARACPLDRPCLAVEDREERGHLFAAAHHAFAARADSTTS